MSGTVEGVGVKSLGQRLRASVDELERARLVDRCEGLGITNLAASCPGGRSASVARSIAS